MAKEPFSYGEKVIIPWGVDEVHATVVEIYGPPAQRSVVVQLTPELSDFVVDEPTTISMPLDSLRSAASAA